MIANINTQFAHTDSDIADKLQQIILAIHRSPQRRDGWISVQAIAREVDGTEAMADIIAGYISMPEAKPYLRLKRNGRHAYLTEAGHQVAQALLATVSPKTPEASAPGSKRKPVADDTTVDQAATAVKSYAKRLDPLRFEVIGIVTVGRVENKHVYAISIELGDHLIPTDSFASLVTRYPNRRYDGRVVYQDDENEILYLSLIAPIVDAPQIATLCVDRAYLLYALAESLKTLAHVPRRGTAIFPGHQSKSIALADQDSAKIGVQLAALKPPWTRFLWGPPGAGKTYGLAHFVLSLLQKHPDERILITAPSNIAADVALLHLTAQLAESDCADLIDKRQILRYGYPRKTEILTRPELLGSEAMEANSKKIDAYARQLKQAKSRKAPPDQIAKLRAGLLAVQEYQKELVLAHVNHCRVVVTTTTQCYMTRSPIQVARWSTIVIDEVTMVPPAVCLYISSLAEKRFLLAGDPRQLGPVFENLRGEEGTDSDAYCWLGQDIFAFSELPLGEESTPTTDARLTRITSQRRCTADIWAPISHLYPRVASLVDEAKLAPITQLDPQASTAVAVVDLARSQHPAGCSRIKKSWENRGSAQTAVDLAAEMLKQTKTNISIAIITPYRGQYQRLKRLIANQDLEDRVTCGTVHQFQGSEADVVVFDPVDGPGRPNVGHMLTGKQGTRLTNVAISRARAKLIVLADLPWYASHLQREDNTLLHAILQKPTPKPDVPFGSLQPINHHEHPNRKPVRVPPVATAVPMPNIISETDICKHWIVAMPRNAVFQLASRNTKKTLNKQLSELGYQGKYQAGVLETVWRNGEAREIVVNHAKNTVIRLK